MSIIWDLGGSAAQFSQVVFEYSQDGTVFETLGAASYLEDTWQHSIGISLPRDQNFFIRGRGYYQTGVWNGSGSTQISTRMIYLPTIELYLPAVLR
jgi:hypothetical protein